MIPNPAFKGKWAPRKIPNPEFYEDLHPFVNLAPIDAGMASLSLPKEGFYSNSNRFLSNIVSDFSGVRVVDNFRRNRFRQYPDY